jgi:hypothetical protein
VTGKTSNTSSTFNVYTTQISAWSVVNGQTVQKVFLLMMMPMELSQINL